MDLCRSGGYHQIRRSKSISQLHDFYYNKIKAPLCHYIVRFSINIGEGLELSVLNSQPWNHAIQFLIVYFGFFAYSFVAQVLFLFSRSSFSINKGVTTKNLQPILIATNTHPIAFTKFMAKNRSSQPNSNQQETYDRCPMQGLRLPDNWSPACH